MIKLKDVLRIILVLGTCLLSITPTYKHESNAKQHSENPPTPPDSVPTFLSKSPQEGLWEALIYYDIQHPDIVYAQALLETGYFKSKGCTRDHNLFGLYSSKYKSYYKFNHWTESVKAYKEWIQNRYKPPSDYYEFLRRIHYAEDPRYIIKLKQIVKKHGKVKQNASTSHNQ